MNTALLPQLQTFLVVARLRSFSSAARELGVSRSAVSQAVRELEEQLRVVLLARTTRSVSLTDAGRRLVDGAGPSLGQGVAALAEVSAQPGEVVGRVRLSVPRVAVPFVIDPVLSTFARVTRGSRSRSSSTSASWTSWPRATTPAYGSANRSSACKWVDPPDCVGEEMRRILWPRRAEAPAPTVPATASPDWLSSHVGQRDIGGWSCPCSRERPWGGEAACPHHGRTCTRALAERGMRCGFKRYTCGAYIVVQHPWGHAFDEPFVDSAFDARTGQYIATASWGWPRTYQAA